VQVTALINNIPTINKSCVVEGPKLYVSCKHYSFLNLYRGRTSSNSKFSAFEQSGEDVVVVDAVTDENDDKLSIYQVFDKFCTSMKPRADRAREKAVLVEDKVRKILYSTKACVYLSIFITYRAYRGFFVLLPEVFREVYRNMETVVDSPFADINDEENNSTPRKGKLPTGASIKVFILTSILTSSYVISGFCKVLRKFIGEARKTSSAEPAFRAAADTFVANEGQLMSLTSKKD